MRTWSVVSQKGGSGKTTVLLHVALAAMAEGETVAVVDTDPQRSADKWAGLRAARNGDNEPVIVAGKPEALKDMAASARDNGTDLLLIDTPGVIDRTLAFVAANSDLIIVPTRSSSLDRDSLEDTLVYLGVIHALPKTVVVLNAFTASKTDRKGIEEVLERHGVARLKREIEHNPSYATLLGQGAGATEARRPGKPAQTVREVYRQLREHDARLARQKPKVRA